MFANGQMSYGQDLGLYDPMQGYMHGFQQIMPGPSSSLSSSSSSGIGATATVGAGRPLTSYDYIGYINMYNTLQHPQHYSAQEHWMSLDEQERRKLERKRARNRAAASKCRQKKMDRINELETQVQTEKAKSQILDNQLMNLRTTLAQLEHLVQRHRANGCSSAQC